MVSLANQDTSHIQVLTASVVLHNRTRTRKIAQLHVGWVYLHA